MLRSTVLGLALLSQAHAADAKLTFEAAAIKEGDHILVPSCMVGPGTLEYRCWATIPGLIASALGLPAYAIQQEKAPIYFVDAKFLKGTTKDRVNEMLRNLLVDRFGLVYHFEKKEMEGYFLTADPKGPKLSPNTEEPAEIKPFAFVVGRKGAAPPTSGRPGYVPGTFELRRTLGKEDESNLTGKAVTMKMLAATLSQYYQIVVVDETGIQGRYDFHLIYKDPNYQGNELSQSQAKEMWAVIQSDLGLKMTHKRGPVDFLVLDHVDKVPKEN